MDELETRVRDTEVNVGKLAESIIDLRERIDTHKDYCPMPEHKETINKTITDLNSRFNNTLGIFVTIFIIYFSALSYIQLSKVNVDDFKTGMMEMKQEEIRRDERIQILTEQQQRLQIELIKEMNQVKIEVARLSNNLGNR
jgi:hypothetical protein